MTKEEIEKEIEKLYKLLDFHAKRLGKLSMSEREHYEHIDSILDELEKLGRMRDESKE